MSLCTMYGSKVINAVLIREIILMASIAEISPDLAPPRREYLQRESIVLWTVTVITTRSWMRDYHVPASLQVWKLC